VVERNITIKMPLGMEADLGPGHIVFDGAQLPFRKGHIPLFSAHVYCGQTVVHLSYCSALVTTFSWLFYVKTCVYLGRIIVLR